MISVRTGCWYPGMGFRLPAIIRRALLMKTSIFFTCGLLLQAGMQYSVAEKARACVDIYSILAEALHIIPTGCRMSKTLDIILALTSSKCCLKDSI